MANDFTTNGTAVVSAPETRTDDPTAASPGMVVRPINSADGPIFVEEVPATDSTVTAVPASIAPVSLLAAQPTRLGFSIRNTSTVDTLYILAASAGVVSSALHTVALRPGSYYEDPDHYVGEVSGVWEPAATDGAAMVTVYLP